VMVSGTGCLDLKLIEYVSKRDRQLESQDEGQWRWSDRQAQNRVVGGGGKKLMQRKESYR
jgi:hypothetical protein